MKKPSFFSPLYLSLFILLLLSCQLSNVTSNSSNPAAGYDIDRNNAIFLAGGQPRTLDPAQTLGGPDDALGHIFSGLVTLDTHLQIQPDLAAGWTVSEDGLVYTFYLRKNAVFHNGRSVTAQDVIFSWERAASPAIGSNTVQTYLGDIEGVAEVLAGQTERISGLQALDDHTLQVRLTAPIVYFLAKLAYPVAFVVDRENVAQADWEHQANGTGPFVLQEWKDDEIMVLRRFDNFYRQPASISHLVFLMGAGLPLSMYETAEIDIVGIGGGTLERARDPNNEFAQELHTGVRMCTSTIGLNTRIPPFDNVQVRQAFNYALDKELLIDVFLSGNGLVATGPLPPGMPGFDGTHIGYPFDPERARQLLTEAGYANPADFPVITYYTSGYGEVGAFETAVITMWQENLGIQIEPIVLDPFLYYDELYSGNIGNIYDNGWCADYPDPQNFLDILYHSASTQNIGGYSNPEVDGMLETARVERDVAIRLGLYGEIEEKLIEEAPVIFVDYGLSAVLVKPSVQGYVLTPIGVPQWHYVSKQ